MNNEDDSALRVRRCLGVFFSLICFFSLMAASFVFAAENNKAATHVKFRDVVEKARVLSKTAFQSPGKGLPDILKKMGYDQWRGIRFKPSKSLWAREPFSVQFFHPGFLYKQPVLIHDISRDGTHAFPFSSDFFEYQDDGVAGRMEDDYGFAGFRVHYPLNTPQYADELVAFLGASYFRALGRNQVYGISARGLAVNTAEAGGEEFPFFREFWIVHPASSDKQIEIYALLDSASVVGAYTFTVIPGDETVVKVACTLFIRQPVQKFGIAPLTSMFYYGENSGFKGDADFRPEVHDSDGLLVHAQSGEWIWHPLTDSPQLLVNAFGGGLPVGFGLMQRDTNFDHYQDLEARYEKRPSVWVTPKGDWGKGHVELVQLPTESEYNDNVVTYWVPEKEFARGDVLTYAYTLTWQSGRYLRPFQGFVASTRVVKKNNAGMFIVDFEGDGFRAITNDKLISADTWVSRGARITDSQLIKNPVSGGWRLVLHVKWDGAGFMEDVLPNQKETFEFRAFLKNVNVPVTETWSYTYQP
ncbi:MAG: glucan biosynthesis protein G [Candidatus Omnitrophota bacterium]